MGHEAGSAVSFVLYVVWERASELLSSQIFQGVSETCAAILEVVHAACGVD